VTVNEGRVGSALAITVASGPIVALVILVTTTAAGEAPIETAPVAIPPLITLIVFCSLAATLTLPCALTFVSETGSWETSCVTVAVAVAASLPTSPRIGDSGSAPSAGCRTPGTAAVTPGITGSTAARTGTSPI
jgi:hypothetical protein